MTPLVQLQEVRREYEGGATRALSGVSLEIEEGEFAAVMGPSGCGKSTLLNLVAGLDRPSAGRVVVDGVDLSQAGEAELARFRRTRIGFVFQFFNLLPSLTALENVMVPAELAGAGRRVARERAMELFEQLQLEGRESVYPAVLSGGERQRVAVARALVNRPRLILADEPTGALDSAAGEQVMEVLGELNRRGQTVLMVTHDVKLAAGHGRRVIAMRDGRVIDDTRIEAGRAHAAGELIQLSVGEA